MPGRPIRYCSIEGCEERCAGRGWCKMHYARWQRHGDPLAPKTCRRCGATKPLDAFYRSRSNRDGRQPMCRDCSKADMARWQRENPERLRTRVAEWAQRRRHEAALKLGVDLSAELVPCGICGRQLAKADRRMDHDHQCCGARWCGKCLRGILCNGCNMGLGNFGDDPERLVAAAAYLISTRPEHDTKDNIAAYELGGY